MIDVFDNQLRFEQLVGYIHRGFFKLVSTAAGFPLVPSGLPPDTFSMRPKI